MRRLAFHTSPVHMARRLLVAGAAGAFVFLLVSTAPHWVHHAREAAQHAPVACPLYLLAASVQWLTLAAVPVLAVWLAHRPVCLGHTRLPDFPIPPLLRARAPPPIPHSSQAQYPPHLDLRPSP